MLNSMENTMEEILNNLPGGYTIQVNPHVDFDKAFRKDSQLYRTIERIFFRMSQNPFIVGKPLRDCFKDHPRNEWRVPIRNCSHVLIYTINKEDRTVTVISYSPHKKAYKVS